MNRLPNQEPNIPNATPGISLTQTRQDICGALTPQISQTKGHVFSIVRSLLKKLPPPRAPHPTPKA